MSTANNNHSYFWRHAEQLEALYRHLRAIERRSVSAWCAGCANGEEAYSLALLLDELGMSAKILATDINEEVLRRAREGVYSESKLRYLPPRHLNRLTRTEHGWSVPERLRAMVEYRWDDLRDSRVSGPFDIIFCRNVLIYFPASMQATVLTRLSQMMVPAGLLVLGYAESSLLKVEGLKRVDQHAIFSTEEAKPTVKVIPAVPGVSLLSEALSSYSAGHLDQAGELLDLSLGKDPDSPIGLYFKAMLNLESGNRRESQILLRRILDNSHSEHLETGIFLREHGLDLGRFLLTVQRVLQRLEARA